MKKIINKKEDYVKEMINKGVEPPRFSVEELNKWKYPEKFSK